MAGIGAPSDSTRWDERPGLVIAETTVNRRDVFRALADESTVRDDDAITVETMARRMGGPPRDIEAELAALIECELAVRVTENEFRVSRTGEELRELGIDDPVIVDACGGHREDG